MPSKRSHRVVVPMDDDLYQQVKAFAKHHKVRVAPLIRAWVRNRFVIGRALPPDIEQEFKRPSRKKKVKADEE